MCLPAQQVSLTAWPWGLMPGGNLYLHAWAAAQETHGLPHIWPFDVLHDGLLIAQLTLDSRSSSSRFA